MEGKSAAVAHKQGGESQRKGKEVEVRKGRGEKKRKKRKRSLYLKILLW